MPSRDLKVTLLGVDKTGGAFKSAADGADGLGGKFAKFGGIAATALAAAGAGVGAFAVSALKSGASFDATLRQMAAVAGVPQAELKQLSDLALKMGADTSFSAQEAADAMLELAKGGLSAAQIEAGALKETLTLAAAGGVGLAEAATFMSNSLNAFGLEAADSAQVAAALAGGANASTASVESLGQALGQVGLGAVNAGLSLQETVAALAAFDQAGIKGSDAGTSLKTMLTRLVPSTDEAAGAMRDLGIDFTTADGSFKSLSEVSQILKERLGGLSAEQRTTALNTIFGSDATRAASVLMKEGAAGIEAYTRATSDMGAANEVAASKTAGLAGAAEAFGGSIDTVKTRVGLALAPLAETAVRSMTDVVNAFGSAIPQIQEKVSVWAPAIGGAVSSAFAAVKPDLSAFLSGVAASLTAGGQQLIDGIRTGVETGDWAPLGTSIGNALSTAFEGVVGAAVELTARLGELVQAVDWFGLSMELGRQVPTMLVGLATGILNFDLPGLLRGLGDNWFRVLVGVLTIMFAPARLLGAVGQMLGRVPLVGPLLRWAFDGFTGLVKGTRGAIEDFLSFVGRNFLEGFRRVFPGIGTGFLSHLRNLPTYVQVVALEVADRAVALMRGLADAIRRGAGAVIARVSELGADMLRPFVGLPRVIAEAGGRIIDGLIGGLMNRFPGVFSALVNLTQGVRNAIRNPGELLRSVGRAIVDGLVNGIRAVGGRAVQAARDLASSVANAAKSFLGIRSPSTVFFAFGEETVQGYINGVLSKDAEAKATIQDLVTDALSGVQDVLGGFNAIFGRQDAQADLVKAEDALAEARQRKQILPGLIRQAERDLADMRRDGSDAADALAQAERDLVALRQERQAADLANAESAARLRAAEEAAEQALSEMRSKASDSVDALKAAEEELSAMREERQGARAAVQAAERELTEARLQAVSAEKALFDAGQDLIGQGPQAEEMFRKFADQAGLTAGAVQGLVERYRDLGNVMRVGVTADQALLLNRDVAGISARVRAIFDNRGVSIAKGTESEDQRIARITREVLAGRSFDSVRTSVDNQRPIEIIVQDRSGNPTETARATQLALRTAL